MTLKIKSFWFAFLIISVLLLIGVVSRNYMAANSLLGNFIDNLDKLKHSVHKIEIQALSGKLGPEQIEKNSKAIQLLLHQLREQLPSEDDSMILRDLGISMIRVMRMVNKSLSGEILPQQALLEQLHNEAAKIEQTANNLHDIAKKRKHTLQTRLDLLFNVSYFILLIGTVVAFYAALRMFIYPILSLSRQINEVKEGKRDEIAASNRHDEIGLLIEFIRKTFASIRAQGSVLQKKQQELNAHLQRQVAISKILKLTVTTDTMEELLNGTLEIILSLDWLQVMKKGAIFFIDPLEPDCLELRTAFNFSPDILKKCARVPFGRCLCGRAAMSKKMIHTAEIDERHENSYSGMTPHGHYCVPLLFGNELLGIMIFYLAAGQAEHPDEAGFLIDVASILAETIARRRLEEQQKLITTAVDQAGEGVLITDIDGNIKYANPFMTALTGHKVSELLGSKSHFSQMWQQDGLTYKHMMDTVMSGANWEGTITRKRKDGTSYQEKIVITPVTDTSGTITHFVAIKRDITTEKALESQLVQAQKMESVGRLAGGVAHDFNNILSIILGYSDIILEELPEGSLIAEDAKLIKESAQRAAALTRQLLAFSRKQVLEMQVVNVNFLIENTFKMLGRMIREDIALELKVDASAKSILADSAQIEQVLMNLAVNARDAMPSGGRLIIETADVAFGAENPSSHEEVIPGAYTMIAISDTGNGMPRETRERIFEPFFTTKEKGKGTGLGLATVYGIVKQHNGYIYVYSEPDKGTTFRIYFPVIHDDFIQKNDDALHEKPKGTETILVVEDEPLLRKYLEDMLEPLGYKLLAAGNGEEALRMNAEYADTIHLMLTDVIMPGINGRDLADLMIKERQELKVIFMSGYTDDVIAHHGVLEAGMTFVQKPVTSDKLAGKIREVLNA